MSNSLFKNSKIKLYDTISPYFYYNALLRVHMEFIYFFNFISYPFTSFIALKRHVQTRSRGRRCFFQIFFLLSNDGFLLKMCTYDLHIRPVQNARSVIPIEKKEKKFSNKRMCRKNGRSIGVGE